MPVGVYPRPSFEDSFWSKVDRSGECWLWTAYRTKDGYGQFRWRRAHRVAWELAHGPIEPGLYVCHRCDTPACVRPEHLFLGTQRENIDDMMRKGRGDWSRVYHAAGERHYKATLTDDQIREMRAMFAAGTKQAELMRKFGVTREYVWRVVHNRVRSSLT